MADNSGPAPHAGYAYGGPPVMLIMIGYAQTQHHKRIARLAELMFAVDSVYGLDQSEERISARQSWQCGSATDEQIAEPPHFERRKPWREAWINRN